VRAVKLGRPDAQVTVVAPDALADFWKNAPGVDAVIAVAPGGAVFATAKKIRRAGRFDAAILFAASRRAALEVFFGTVPKRLGPPRRFLLNHWANQPGMGDPPPSGAERYRRITIAAGARMD
jgi:ADP-heptose:LPS heptosyltransferase